MGAMELVLIRHAESAGNVAATKAQRSGAEVIDCGVPDAEVPLTDAGQAQGKALSLWLTGLPEDERPEAVWCSPYLRARQTAELARLQSPRFDERLRDRELGILDLLTSAGVSARFPEEARRRNWVGKFSYRPPGGESWADVALRLRSMLRDLDDEDDGKRVAVVCHDAVILLIRYICEQLSETALLDMAASTSVRNASITRLMRPAGKGRWVLASFNAIDHLESGAAPVTEHAGDENHVHPR